MLIARVLVNTVNKGDIAILRDAQGRTFVPLTEYAKWGLSPPGGTSVSVGGESYVDLSTVTGLDVSFDVRTVTLEIGVAASALPASRINLGPERRADVIFPTTHLRTRAYHRSGDP